MGQPTVKLFALSTCGHCHNAKRLFDAESVAYDFVDVDLCEEPQRTEVLDEVRKFNPNLTFPTIVIGDSVIVGYREKEIREALGL